ncbi:bifunctional DNA primase/polymerase, partial [Cyanobium sp. T1B-Tous]
MPLHPQLIESLQAIDSDWALLPIDGRKRPVDPQSGQPLEAWARCRYDLDAIAALAANPHVQAVGLLLGSASGVLAVDFDGRGAGACFRRIYGRSHRELPPTVGWSSGLPHRGQLAFRVPRELWPLLRGRRCWVSGGEVASRRTVFELRWEGHQSVIAGAHPSTGGYHWITGQSPAERQVADAPEWLLEPLFKQPDEPTTAEYAPSAQDVPRAL